MAGTIPGIALVCNLDENSEVMAGCLLRIYEAGTVTPVTAYKDAALTSGQEHPWPIPADAAGRLPYFFLADGNYRIRLSSSNGMFVAYDVPNLATVASSSSDDDDDEGGSASTNVFATGYIDWDAVDEARDGWVRLNGRTIGSATSGATERANSDVHDLYVRNWTKYDNSICAVTGGRGANAEADWAANKAMATLNMRFTIAIGLDTMGNSAANLATNVPVVSGNASTAASILGAPTTTLTKAQLPDYDLDVTVTDEGHTHDKTYNNVFGLSGSGSSGIPGGGASGVAQVDLTISSATTGIEVEVSSGGSGQAHNNTPRVMTGTWYQKL